MCMTSSVSRRIPMQEESEIRNESGHIRRVATATVKRSHRPSETLFYLKIRIRIHSDCFALAVRPLCSESGSTPFSSMYYTQYYLITYVLTTWSRILLTGSQLVKKFPAFYGNGRFLTSFTSACQLSLSWAFANYLPHLNKKQTVISLARRRMSDLIKTLFSAPRISACEIYDASTWMISFRSQSAWVWLLTLQTLHFNISQKWRRLAVYIGISVTLKHVRVTTVPIEK